MDEAIGNLQARALVAFMLEETGPSIYNKVVSDAEDRLQARVMELDFEVRWLSLRPTSIVSCCTAVGAGAAIDLAVARPDGDRRASAALETMLNMTKEKG